MGVPQETHQPQGDAVRHRPTETRRPGRVTPPVSRAPTGQQPKAPPKCQPPTWGPPTFWPFTRKRDPEVSQQLSQPVCPLKFCPIEWNRRSPSFPCLDSKKGSKSRISILSTHVHRSSGLSSSRRWHLSPGVLHQLDQLIIRSPERTCLFKKPPEISRRESPGCKLRKANLEATRKDNPRKQSPDRKEGGV